jgi:hypothetical protein
MALINGVIESGENIVIEYQRNENGRNGIGGNNQRNGVAAK